MFGCAQKADTAAGPDRFVTLPRERGLTPAQTERALTLIMRDSFYSQSLTTLTTGVFLVGLALHLNAPNFIIGLLASLPALAQLIQLPSISLVEKLRSRRRITVVSTLASRLFLLPMALTPWMPEGVGLPVFLLSYVCHLVLGAPGNCAWISWLKDVVLARDLGSFFSRKLGLATLITIALTLLGGLFADAWIRQFSGMPGAGYGLLFLAAMLIGLAGVPPLTRIPEPPLRTSARKAAMPFFVMLRRPLRDANFRKLLTFMASWHFAVNLAAPFVTVYMLTMLHYSIALVTVLTIAGQVANLCSLRIWGALADRFSNKSVLRISAPLLIFCLLGWTFTTLPEPHGLTLPMVFALQILLGVATAGVTLANGNIALKLAPGGKATPYLAANNFAASLAAGTAPILGGLFADFFARAELSITLNWHAPGSMLNVQPFSLHHWDFFFLFAFLLGLYALSRLNRVREDGDVADPVILSELVGEARRSIHNLACGSSTVMYMALVTPIKLTRLGLGHALSRQPGRGGSSK